MAACEAERLLRIARRDRTGQHILRPHVDADITISPFAGQAQAAHMEFASNAPCRHDVDLAMVDDVDDGLLTKAVQPDAVSQIWRAEGMVALAICTVAGSASTKLFTAQLSSQHQRMEAFLEAMRGQAEERPEQRRQRGEAVLAGGWQAPPPALDPGH